MTNYVQSTNFATKDALPSGDPLKIVKGTEINTEFNNIATAVATKADLASPTFTGTVTVPTLALTNDLAIADGGTGASTAAGAAANLAVEFGKLLYPVGSIYINAGVTTNPATLLGFGTWTAFGAGRVMVGLNGSDALFDALEETGGSKDAIVVSHTHTATSTVTDPGHRHRLQGDTGGAVQTLGTQSGAVAGIGPGSTGPYVDSFSGTSIIENATTGITVATTNASTGSSGTNANLQPYITVAMWKRTA
jgi:hypothetical protein